MKLTDEQIKYINEIIGEYGHRTRLDSLCTHKRSDKLFKTIRGCGCCEEDKPIESLSELESLVDEYCLVAAKLAEITSYLKETPDEVNETNIVDKSKEEPNETK